MSNPNQWVPRGSKPVFGVSIALVTLSCIAVVLRFISRIWIRKRLSVDDWLILLAWVMSLALSVALCIGESHSPIDYQTPAPEIFNNMDFKYLRITKKARLTIMLLYNPILTAAKMSILFFQLSLFGNFKSLKLCIYITMSTVSVGGIILTLLIFFQCRPASTTFSSYYTPEQPKADCLDTIMVLYASAPLNIITDLAILLLPMPALTALKLPRKEKIILICLFGGGGFVAVVGVVRVCYLDQAILSKYGNLNWDASLSFMWSAIEVNVSIVCASIPMLRGLIILLIPGFFGLSSHEISPELNHEPRLRGLDSSMNDRIQLSLSNSNTPNLYSSQNAPNIPTVDAPLRKVSKALALVIILYFLWGFLYGLLCVLKGEFQANYNISVAQSLGLQTAYYTPYLLTPQFFSGTILKKHGFKATLIAGLLLYTASSLVYWPALILGSFPGYLTADVLAGFGMSTLETAASPYVALVGPLGMGECRLDFAEGFQAIGIICAGVLQYHKDFSMMSSFPNRGVADINWIFLAIAIFVVSLAVVFYFFELPEINDSEYSTLAMCETDSFWRNKGAIGPALAIATVFFYMGAQETFMAFWDGCFTAIGMPPSLHTLGWKIIGTGLFIGGRFVGSTTLLWFCPRIILIGSVIGCAVTSGLAIVQTGKAEAIMFILNRLFQSSVFAIVFAMGLRGAGRHTKTVSIYLVTAISGGGAIPWVYYAVAKHYGHFFAIWVPTISFSLCIVFPLYCYLSPDQRNRFGSPIRGDTIGQLNGVPSMTMDFYRYVRKRFGTGYLNSGESNERIA